LHSPNRREFLRFTLAAAGALAVWPLPLHAEESACKIPHPITPPDPRFKGQCPNCGMIRAMWARTWMRFENSEGMSEVCSFHCLADVALKSGEEPRNVEVALYTRPDTTRPAKAAFFVVGSSARGTMTMQSKIAFGTQEAAGRFSRSCGGQVVSYETALELARQGVPREKKVIAAKRLKMEKVIEPRDNQDRCPVCEMFPARYPRHKSQLQTRDKTVYHFCSTQCLFAFLEDSPAYGGRQVDPFLIWVVDYETRAWISARTAYYVVGAGEAGPMGREAFAFDRKSDAAAFARQHGGTVRPFAGVTREIIMK
jgi:nitrous oxide reductase accessory protein NosL